MAILCHVWNIKGKAHCQCEHNILSNMHNTYEVSNFQFIVWWWHIHEKPVEFLVREKAKRRKKLSCALVLKSVRALVNEEELSQRICDYGVKSTNVFLMVWHSSIALRSFWRCWIRNRTIEKNVRTFCASTISTRIKSIYTLFVDIPLHCRPSNIRTVHREREKRERAPRRYRRTKKKASISRYFLFLFLPTIAFIRH